jgi:hypothetical protein
MLEKRESHVNMRYSDKVTKFVKSKSKSIPVTGREGP